MEFLDPTMTSDRACIDYAPRPAHLEKLRVGLIDNTRKNSEAVLRKLAEKLEISHGIKLEVLINKHERAPLKDDQIADLKARTDFVIVGVGD